MSPPHHLSCDIVTFCESHDRLLAMLATTDMYQPSILKNVFSTRHTPPFSSREGSSGDRGARHTPSLPRP